MSTLPKETLEAVPRPLVRTLLVRLVMLLILAASVGLVLWSYFGRFQPVNRRSREKARELQRVGNQINQLALKWDATEAARTEALYTNASALLLTGSEAFNDWQKQVQRKSLAFGLDATVQPGKAESQPQGGLKISVFPATIELRPNSAKPATNSSYQRVLALIDTLVKTDRRVEVVELSATGNSNSIQQANVVVQLWRQEGTP